MSNIEIRSSENHSPESNRPSGSNPDAPETSNANKQKTVVSDDNTPVRNQESHGLLGSLMTAAHNAANIINPKRDKVVEPETTGSVDDRVPTESHSSDPNLLSFSHNSAENPNSQELGRLQASNVHFEPVHDSPVNTLGNGDLTLSHFEEKAANSLSPNRSHSGKEYTQGAMSGSNENKFVRKKLLTNHSNGSEHTLATEDAENTSFEPENSSMIETDSVTDSSHLGEPNSKKRKEFRSTFKNIPPSEELLAEVSCALSKDILVHGKLYLTKNLICFNSNILGWVTNLIIPIQEVIQIEKKSTAVLFPNGMVIKTLYQKYVFASFLSRDTTYSLITKVWNNALRNNSIDNSARIQKKNSLRPVDSPDSHPYSQDASDNESDVDSDDESSSESNGGHDSSFLRKIKSKRRNSNKVSEGEKEPESNSSDFDAESPVPAKSSEDVDDPSPTPKNDTSRKVGLFKGFQNPGPATHKPTNPSYPKDHVHIIDYSFKAPLGVVFSLFYGPDNSTFVKMLESSKNFDIKKDGITELNAGNKERNYTYIKPLSGSIGPKQAKCVISETLLECDFDNYCEVEQVTQTPDVPSGGSFKVKTKQFFSWGADNTTKFSVYSNIEWSAKSWIKGAIEKGSLDGQKTSMKDMTDFLNDYLNSGASVGSKGKRKKTKSVSQHPAAESASKVEEKPPPTTIELLKSLLDSIGSSLPINSGVLGNKGLGSLLIVAISVLYSCLLLKLFGGKGNSVVFGNNGPSTVRINDDRFYLTPTIETRLRSQENRASSSAELWYWILSRTGELESMEAPKHTDAEKLSSEPYKEILRLTKERIDEAYKEIS